MLEGELESAICRRFDVLLADLAQEGYKLLSRQAVLHGRRLDLLLRREADDHHCIIELKAGHPPMPLVRDQLLDYARCWIVSYPQQPRPRMIVVSTALRSATAHALAEAGLESRVISEADVLAALEDGQGSSVPHGLRLAMTETQRIRDLLSDKDLLAIPEGMRLAAPWDNLKVCLALAKRGEKHKDLWKKNIAVQIYQQGPGCAVLYLPTTVCAASPLHLNPRRRSWREDVFVKLKPFIRYVGTDNKGPGKESGNFDHYSVHDWDGLAHALGLEDER